MTTRVTTESDEAEREKALKLASAWADAFALPHTMAMDMGEPIEGSPAYPDWVVACGKKVARALFPKAYVLDNEKLTQAYKAGLFFGMMTASEQKVAQLSGKIGILPEAPSADQLKAFADRIYGANSGVTLPADGSSLIPEELVAKLEVMEAGLSVEERGLFYAGLADAHSMVAGKNAATDATTLYSTMLVYWRLVDRLTSVDQLHDFLTKVHGQNLVGSDLKRTRQLCLRVGKRFAAPGRPKKLPQTKSGVK